MRRSASLLVVVVAALGGLATPGCGGDDNETPPAVTDSDLQRDGEFWTSLTPDLKDELVEIGKDRLARERGNVVLGADTGELVAEIDKEYANQSKRSTSIFDTYVVANNKLAGEELDRALDQMETLRGTP
jgi:hypothetical protein